MATDHALSAVPRPELGTWGVALFDHMSEQYLTVLRHPERLSSLGTRERFLGLAVEHAETFCA